MVTTSAAPNATSAPAMVWGLSVDTNASTGRWHDPGPALGTGSSYTSRTVGWLGGSSQQAALAEDIRVTSTGTQAITFGAVSGNQFDSFITVAAAFAEPASLPLAVRQACVSFSGSTNVNFQTGSFASATLAGSTIFVVGTCNSAGANMTFADAINGAYVNLDTVIDPGATQALKGFMFQNAASIGTSNVLTVTPSTGAKNTGFVAFEIQGAPTPYLAAHAAGLQTLATNTANAIASPTVQAGVGSAIAIAVSANFTANNATYAPSVGTGYTICPSPGGNFWVFNALNLATAEYQTLTNPGGMNATFTPPGSTSDDYTTFIAVFNQIGGAFVPPFTLTQFFVNDQYFQS